MNIPTVLFPCFVTTLCAFLVNIPLGYIRQGTKKFSAVWFFWIHASIPLMIFLRITLGVPTWWVPFSILAAIFGQLMGSRYRQRRLQNA